MRLSRGGLRGSIDYGTACAAQLCAVVDRPPAMTSQPASQTHQTVRDPQLYCSCPHSLLAHHQTSSSSISFAYIPRSIITTSYHSSDPCRLSNRERKGMHHPLNAFSPILAPRPASSAPSPDAPRLAGRDRHTPTCLSAHRSTSESTAYRSVAIHTSPDNRRSAAFTRCCTPSSALNNPSIALRKLAGFIQTRLEPCELATNIIKVNDPVQLRISISSGDDFAVNPAFELPRNDPCPQYPSFSPPHLHI